MRTIPITVYTVRIIIYAYSTKYSSVKPSYNEIDRKDITFCNKQFVIMPQQQSARAPSRNIIIFTSKCIPRTFPPQYNIISVCRVSASGLQDRQDLALTTSTERLRLFNIDPTPVEKFLRDCLLCFRVVKVVDSRGPKRVL